MSRLSFTRREESRPPAGVLVAGLAVLALAGCGAPSGSGASGGAGAGTPDAPKSCGAVHVGGPGSATQTPASGAQASTDCFWQAYTACQPATIVYTTMGVDTYAEHTFTISPNASGGCGVTDRVHSMINVKTTDYGPLPCSGVRQGSAGELVIAGCDQFGDITVP